MHVRTRTHTHACTHTHTHAHAQLEEVVKFVKAAPKVAGAAGGDSDLPPLLVGDFNAGPDTDEARILYIYIYISCIYEMYVWIHQRCIYFSGRFAAGGWSGSNHAMVSTLAWLPAAP